MLSILWEIVLPLFIAFIVGWVVMGWLTWRWRWANVSRDRWERVNEELALAQSQLGQAETRMADLEAASAAAAAEAESARATVATMEPTVVAEPTVAAEPTITADELTAIRGIGAKMEAKLHDLGITSLHQIAAFTDDEIERVSAGIGAFPGRIGRDRWVEQAKDLVEKLPPASPAADPMD